MLENAAKLRKAVTRLVTAENVYGAKGVGGMAVPFGDPGAGVARLGQPGCENNGSSRAARELGQTWKVRPCLELPAGAETPLMDVECSGAVTHVWMTYDVKYARDLILRFYWDGEESPSVECPAGDFFCAPFCRKIRVSAVPVCVNPTNGLNCYLPMPFRSRARITVENRSPEGAMFYYAISFEEREVDPDEAYFHARFRRENPTSGTEDYVILDGVKGRGQYVGTAVGWQQNSEGWWGEGEVKMFLDGDSEFATYVGTGTEDYFGGAWSFEGNFSAPFLGYQDLSNVLDGRTTNRVGNRHAMYRFHIADPIHFEQSLRVTIQTLGWRSEWRYLPLRDDICSVAYWYQTEPHAPFPAFPSRDETEVI